MSSLELALPRSRAKTWVAVVAFAAIFVLLFQYRILSLAGKLGVSVTPLGTKFPLVLNLQGAPQWLVPIYSTIDYLNTVWFSTLLGLLFAGAAATFLPGFFQSRMRGGSFKEHLTGTLLGIPNMLCTCCAATTLPGLRRAGAGRGPALAFFVTAPSLNLVVIILAFQLLPLKLALIRTVLGLIAAVGLTYAIAKLYPGPGPEAKEAACKLPEGKSALDLIWTWLGNTWATAKIALPMLIVGILLISILKVYLPVDTIAKSLGNGLVPTLIAAVLGTVVMVPTFTEVLWVSEFTKQGMGMGPAVALLITLPAVSFPSLWVLGRVFKSYRLAASLGTGVLLLGIVSGLLLGLI